MIGSCGPGSGGGCDTPVLVKVQVTVSSAAKVMEAVAVPGPGTGGAVVGKELVARPEPQPRPVRTHPAGPPSPAGEAPGVRSAGPPGGEAERFRSAPRH